LGIKDNEDPAPDRSLSLDNSLDMIKIKARDLRNKEYSYADLRISVSGLFENF
jgi:hypothetical protein